MSHQDKMKARANMEESQTKD